jgi:SAM-dependent methyltransferase
VSTYYDEHAEEYSRGSLDVDLSELRQRFTCLLPSGGAICDAGCGSGRDAKAFLEQGFEVTAFDASAGMVRLASQYTGLPVRHLRFEDMDYKQAFDGIWCCASLLHVPPDEEQLVYRRIIDALKPGGIWYLSYKLGQGQREEGGRVFTDHTPESLKELPGQFDGIRVLDLWATQDRMGRGKEWANGLVRRSYLSEAGSP